jgi:hypothetical protein
LRLTVQTIGIRKPLCWRPPHEALAGSFHSLSIDAPPGGPELTMHHMRLVNVNLDTDVIAASG